MASGGLLGLWDPDGPRGEPAILTDPAEVSSIAAERTVIVRCAGRDAGRVRRAIVASGRSVGPPLITVPAGREPEHVVTLDPTFRWGGSLIGRSDRAAQAVAMAAVVPGARRVLTSIVPSLALVGTPQGRSPQEWLGSTGPASAASRSHRSDAATATLRVGSEAGITAYVQVGLDSGGDERVAAAGRGLRTVGASAVAAGITVPDVLQGVEGALVTAALPGRCLGGSTDRALLASVGERLVDALGRWQSATASPSGETGAHHAAVARAADVLAETDRALGVWAGNVARRLRSSGVPCVAVHGDLTAWNVVVPPSGTVGLVDWESASSNGVAMTDCWYLLADLAVATGSSRSDAVMALADGGSPLSEALLTKVRGIEDRLGLDAEDRRLAFDATWVLHAAAESTRSESGGFVAAARALAQRSASA